MCAKNKISKRTQSRTPEDRRQTNLALHFSLVTITNECRVRCSMAKWRWKSGNKYPLTLRCYCLDWMRRMLDYDKIESSWRRQVADERILYCSFVALDWPVNCFNVGTLLYYFYTQWAQCDVTDIHAFAVPLKILRFIMISWIRITHTGVHARTHLARSRAERFNSFRCNDFKRDSSS